MIKSKPSFIKRLMAGILAVAIIFTMSPVIAMAGEAVDLEWYNFRNNAENNGVVDKATPNSADTAALKWSGKYGQGWSAAPTPPLILDDYIYVGMSNKIVKIDKKTGNKVAESDEMVSSVGFAMNPITYADGKLFVQVGDGIIQAVDYETLKCVWSTEKIGGQTVSPISYAKVDGKGYIYTGTWKSSSADGALLCISTDDSNVDENGIKKAEWRFVPSGSTDTFQDVVYDDTPVTCDEELKKEIEAGAAADRGFYWVGAYACDKYIAVGSDDGANDYGDPADSACFYTIDPKTGEIIDKIGGIRGDIRTSTVYDDGYLYFCTKGGVIYKVSVDADGNLGEVKTADMGGAITATPVIYNGRIYVGVAGTGAQFDPDGGHFFAVVDAENMTKMRELPIKGYPQASALLSTAYEDEDFNGDGEADGRVYIYFTYNALPGGIYYTYDATNEKDAAKESGELFVPDTQMQNYCISTICTDDDGTLYYKNDSCYLMAVSNNVAYISGMEIEGAKNWSRTFAPGVTEYDVVMAAGAERVKINLTLPDEVTATIDDKDYDSSEGNYVKLDENGKATVKIKADADGGSTVYTLNIRCQSDESSLRDLIASSSNAFGEGKLSISPSFSADRTQYTVDVENSDRNFYNVWPELTDENSSVKVYAMENVQSEEINDDGTIAIASSIDGHDRYAVYPADKSKNTKIRIEVTSESGNETTDYELTFVKDKSAIGGDGTGSDQGNSDSAAAPKTGDGQNVMVWVLIALGACMGTAALVKVERKKQRN
ncbi:MAG: cadherin-like beta sandwich domain-containing protein [Firmicutes bacterium]|nr:cadherin-like beta sandwich domain-containing protein [Bacillota bacterium]